MCCRCSAGTPRPPTRAGARRNGRRAAASCSWCPAIRRSATACRWASLPYVPPAQYPYIVPVDPSVPRGAAAGAREILPSRQRPRKPPRSARRPRPRSPPRPARQDRVEQELGEIGGAVRTAISVEPRDGRLCVFMPPVEALEDYLELVAAAENAAQEDRPAGPYRGLCAAARPAPQRHPRRARPRRHRGQHPSGLQLGRIASPPRRRSTRRRGSRGSAPTSS